MLTHERFEAAYKTFLEAPPDKLIYTEAGWIIAHTHLGPNGKNTILEDWQILAANYPERYQWWGKSRQVGFSWIQALRALARAALFPEIYGRRYVGVFLSINQDEAANKIRYVMEAWDSLSNDLQHGPLKLVSSMQKGLEFANGSRLISYPAKAVRGESGADIVMDEAAHIPKAREVYSGTTSATIRSSYGSIVVGSTPLGESGLFFELGDLDGRGVFPSYKGSRFFVYWWDSAALCRDVKAARKAAAEESWVHHRTYSAVEDRLKRFAVPRLIEEFESLSLEDFLQEYEVAFSTVSNALVSRDLIMAAVDPEWPQVSQTLREAKTHQIDEVLEKIRTAIKTIAPRGPVYAAYDPARTKDQAAIVLVSEAKGHIKVIARVSLIRTMYGVQEYLLTNLLQDSRLVRLTIDITGGMGGPIHERLALHWGDSRVTGVNFTNSSKHQMASKLASLYSHGRIVHTGDPEIIRQVASVRKIPTPSGAMKYEGGGSDEHHADVFWALAMAVLPIQLRDGEPGEMVTVRSQVAEEDGPGGIDRSEYREWLRFRREGF